MKRVLILLALCIALAIGVVPTHAASPITVTVNGFTNSFPQNLVFELEAQSSAKITRVELLAEVNWTSAGITYSPEFTPNTKIQARYEWRIPMNYLPPGTTGQYWWNIQDDAGNTLQTPKQPFRVEDAQRRWQKLANDRLAVFWDEGDSNYGKSIFDHGVQAMDFVENYTGVTVDHLVQIFIYGNYDDFKRALDPRGVTGWEGGVTFYDYGIVLIWAEDANYTLVATAHELTHVIIHQKIRGPFGSLMMPTWLDEGLAMYFEDTPGTLDSIHRTALQQAIRNDTLIPIRSLTGSFPTAQVTLSYTEGWSVVDFIIRIYGKGKLAQLLQELTKSDTYDDTVRRVLGVDVDGLDAAWRQDIGAKPRVIPTRSGVAPTAFPTFGLSTDSTSTPAPRVTGATAVPTTMARVVTPAPVPTAAPRALSNPISQLCGGAFALIAVGIFGPVFYRRTRRSAR